MHPPVAAPDGLPAGIETGIRLTTSDVSAPHAGLLAHGVEAGDVLHWPGVPAMVAFRNEDDSRLELIEAAGPSS